MPPYDTNRLLAKTKAMLAQTAAEGTKPFAGSSYDTTETRAPMNPPTPQIGSSSIGNEPSGDQSLVFGRALQDLLRQSQGMGTGAFKQQEFDAQTAQNQRTAYTSPGLIGASPGLQSSTRNAEAGALQPTISGARQGAQTFSEQLSGFKEGVGSIQDLLAQEQSRMDKERDDARQLINQSLQTFGSKGFDVIDQKFLKLAGYNPETINLAKQTLKEQEITQKLASQPKRDTQVVEVGGRKLLKDMQTGATISDLGVADGGGAGLGGVLDGIDPSAPDYFDKLMVATSGRKAPNQVETIKPIQKSIGVINQLADLQKSVQQTTTGPVIGLLQTLNPYSFDARAIQAQLQAVVPNLARGVYGEVGVLTDADIRNYIQTLPNIRSTKQQNDFVTAMTLKTVQRNLESQLETLASAGYDISGFKNQYVKVKTTVVGLEQQLGIGQSSTLSASGPSNNADEYARYLQAVNGK